MSKPWKFESSDFDTGGVTIDQLSLLAVIANAKLAEWLEASPVVEGDNPDFSWYIAGKRNINCVAPTHTARLICIEPIVRDTAEGLLREALLLKPFKLVEKDWIERARKLLEGE